MRKCHCKASKVVHREPFTIKLTRQSKEYTQPHALRVDSCSGIIGIFALNNNEEGVYASKTHIRNDIKERIDQRRKYRRNRLNRKTCYILNRINSIRTNRFLSYTTKQDLSAY
ncbi:MAG: RRXRR domain-containing protein [Desulfovibrionaceae bacterium]|nr:RRXRR domain-containing protein [Desulfovibrionaceae bacterium]